MFANYPVELGSLFVVELDDGMIPVRKSMRQRSVKPVSTEATLVRGMNGW